jgi:hypothetical protein
MQVHGHVMLEDGDLRVLLRGFEQRALDLASGDVPAWMTLRAECPPSRASSKRQPVVGVFALRERVPSSMSSRMRSGAFFDAQPHDVGLREVRAGDHRVLHVGVEGVGGVEHRRDPALRPGGVGVGPPALGDDRHLAVGRRAEREGEARDAAPQYEEIRGVAHGCPGRYASPGRLALVTRAQAA